MGFTWSGALSAQTKLDEEAAAREELEESRKTSLLGLYLKKLESQASSRTGDKYQNAANAAQKLQQKVGKADLDEETTSFFNGIIEDPFAAEEVLNFIETQGKGGLKIPLSQIPSMIDIVKSKAPVGEKIDYISTITGQEMTDENYYQLAQEISSIPTQSVRTVLTDVKPEFSIDPTAREKRFQFQTTISNNLVVANASRHLVNNPISEAGSAEEREKLSRIQSAVNNIDNKEPGVAARSMEVLYGEFFKPEDLTKLKEDYQTDFVGVDQNPFLKPYFNLQPTTNNQSSITLTAVDNSGNVITSVDDGVTWKDSQGNIIKTSSRRDGRK